MSDYVRKELQPYQQRMLAEQEGLDRSLGYLQQFIVSDAFKGVDPAEQDRLRRQAQAMAEYSAVLAERIGAW